MKSTIVKHSIVVGHHKTSVSLEVEFWNGLKEIAHARNESISDVVSAVGEKHKGNLSSAIRRFVFAYFREHQPICDGHGQIEPAQRY